MSAKHEFIILEDKKVIWDTVNKIRQCQSWWIK